MSNYTTIEERLEIEVMLAKGFSFAEISKHLSKSCSTISREVRRYAIKEKTGYSSVAFNCCQHRMTCEKTKVCGSSCPKRSPLRNCKHCGPCNDVCQDFKEEVCIARLKPPYVCNGCDELQRCTLEKTFYKAAVAQKKADKRISESRRGVFATEVGLERMNALVTPLILQGQSIRQIYVNNIDALMCSEKTLYNYIDNCFFDARNYDLPRKIRYRPRRKK